MDLNHILQSHDPRKASLQILDKIQYIPVVYTTYLCNTSYSLEVQYMKRIT
jgi:hypothetical protein